MPGSAPPTAWAMRPQFGSPPCSAVLTSGELATARAARSTAAPSPPRTYDAPDARGALAVADDVERELAQERVERLAEGAARRRVSGSTATPPAPLAMSIAVSFVESWPSTEMRSNERLTRHAEQQVGRLRAQAPRRSARSTASSRSSAGSSPRPWPARSGAPCRRGQVDVERRALLEGVGGHDRLGEVGVAVGAQAAAPPAAARRPSPGRRAARRSRRSRRRRRGPRARRRRSPPAPCIFAASSSPRPPVAALALPELAATARSASSCVRCRQTSTGAASTPERVKRAALVASGASQTSRPTSRLPDGLSPAATPAARKPAGRPPATSTRALGDVDPARAEERGARRRGAHPIPAVSLRPNIRLRFCTACDDEPFHRLSIAAKTRTLPVRSSPRTRSGRCSCRARRARRAGGRRARRTARPRRPPRTARATSRPSRRGQRDVAGDELALVERQQVRRERRP